MTSEEGRYDGSVLYTEIEIAAPAGRVWSILTDLSAFPSWNPFIRGASGELRTGGRLDILLQPPGGSTLHFRPTVLTATPERELRWIGHLLVPGIFDGEHIFQIEPNGRGGVRFTQMERFGGWLLPLLRRKLRRGTLPGFEAMNLALKERAERPER